MRHSFSHSKTASLLELRARQKRTALTHSEHALFNALRGGRIGVTVRRQVVIAGFIVDFVIPSAKLVIEVDGPYHARRRAADARRDCRLGRFGYRVLRLDAKLVLGDVAGAVTLVRASLAEPP